MADRRGSGGREGRPSEALDPVDAHRRLTTRQVMELVGVKSKNTLWKRIREGKLPEPRYQAARQPRWVVGEVLDSLAQQEKAVAQLNESKPMGVRQVLSRLGLDRGSRGT